MPEFEEFTPDYSQWDNDPQCFQSYFKAHYAPLLNKLADSPYNKIDLTDKDKRLVRLMRDDLLKIYQAD